MKFFYVENLDNKRRIHFLGMKISYNYHPVFRILKQDKKSEVEFYLIDAFEIYHFLPIYKEFLKHGIRARIVAEPCDINVSKSRFDYYTSIKILKENKVNYCTKCNPNAKFAFTTQTVNLLEKYKNKKISISYGVGFNKSYFSNIEKTCTGFDYRFVHGNFQKNKQKEYMQEDHIAIFGYPRYENVFKKKQEELKKELKINTQKPILMYYPTWDEDSSIQMFGNEIAQLKEKFFLITKAHHCTYRLPYKKNDLEKLYRISDLVLEGNYSFLDSVNLADCAIIDAKSGASTEVPYINNDIHILLLSPQSNLSDYFDSIIFAYAKLTNEPQKLYNLVNEVYLSDDYLVNRKKILKEVYDSNKCFKDYLYWFK